MGQTRRQMLLGAASVMRPPAAAATGIELHFVKKGLSKIKGRPPTLENCLASSYDQTKM